MKSGHILIAGALLVSAWMLKEGQLQSEDKQSAPKSKAINAADFASLQKAFDALPNTGGIVRIPPGVYEIDQPLIISQEDVKIIGSGTSTHIVNRNTEGKPALILRPTDRAKNKRARIWRIQIADLRISGNKQSGDGLRAEGINEIYLRGISIDHNGGNGIHLIDCYEDPRVIGCLMTYNGNAGLRIEAGHDIVVSSNQFEENLDALQCVDSFNLCMTGNNLDDHLRHGVVIENTYGSVLSGNMIEECKDTAIVMDRDCYGTTISANVIAHNFGGGVDLRDAWGCAVSANTFTIVAKRALIVGPKSGRITITGNNFSNSHIGGKVRREDAATGVVLENTSDITITGNTFTGMANSAVEGLKTSKRVVLVGNLMHELGLKSKEKPAAIQSESSQSRLIDNNFPTD